MPIAAAAAARLDAALVLWLWLSLCLRLHLGLGLAADLASGWSRAGGPFDAHCCHCSHKCDPFASFGNYEWSRDSNWFSRLASRNRQSPTHTYTHTHTDTLAE